MSTEAKRGCGYRKAGGLYIVGDVAGVAVSYLPFCIPQNQTRSLQWVESSTLLATCDDGNDSPFRRHERIALCFVGAQHYSVESFVTEAIGQGVSRRVHSIPKDLKPGDPIALAHPECIPTKWVQGNQGADSDYRVTFHCKHCQDVPAAKALANWHVALRRSMVKELIEDMKNDSLTPLVERVLLAAYYTKELRSVTGWGEPNKVAGVFGLFHMRAVEVVLPASVATDPAIIAKCADRNVTIVSVPDNDPDHVKLGWKLPRFLLDDDDDQIEFFPDTTTPATEDLA